MNDKEYLMLREEILHLDTIVNNTINFFYVFVSAVLLFSLTLEDSIFILVTYVAIIPTYLIVLSKAVGVYRIAAYLYVFLEGDSFNWERRNKKIMESPELKSFSIMSSYNYPFLFVSSLVMIFFCVKTNWNEIKLLEELLKLFLATILYGVQLLLIIRNRKIDLEKFIRIWERIKGEL